MNLGWLPAEGRGDRRYMGCCMVIPNTGWSVTYHSACNQSGVVQTCNDDPSRAGRNARNHAHGHNQICPCCQFFPRSRYCASIWQAHSIPIITVFGLELGSTLAFAVVTETIFGQPGVGKLIIDSMPCWIGLSWSHLILVAFLFVTINFVIDLIFALIDPRVERGAAS